MKALPLFGLLAVLSFSTMVSAAEPKLSGNYILSMQVSSDAPAVTWESLYQIKVVPNKKNDGSGKMTVVRATGQEIDGACLLDKGDILDYRTNGQNLFISGFKCPRRGEILDSAGISNVVSDSETRDVADEKNFDIYYANIDGQNIARYAMAQGIVETRNMSALYLPASALAVPVSGVYSSEEFHVRATLTFIRQ